MNDTRVFESVKSRINELAEIARRKGWRVTTRPFIDRPATDEEIEAVEQQIGMAIPSDLKTLFKHARHLEFGYQFDAALSEEFRSNFSGEIYWNLNTLAAQFADFQEWIAGSLDPRYNDPEAIAITRNIRQNKFALMNVPNGDVIAIGNQPSRIVYCSHEGDAMHGKVLGNTLWDFLEFHARIGFAGSEDWQLEPFFDFETNSMITAGAKVERFIRLLDL